MVIEAKQNSSQRNQKTSINIVIQKEHFLKLNAKKNILILLKHLRRNDGKKKCLTNFVKKTFNAPSLSFRELNGKKKHPYST